jgi:hypothetical protein
VTRALLLAAILLAGCGCAGAPIAPDAQLQLDQISDTYQAAYDVAHDYLARPVCRFTPQVHCQRPERADALRTAEYEAQASFTTADSERTRKAIADARDKVSAYATAAAEAQ